MFDFSSYGKMPPGFWTAVFFVFGCVVGSFLNVCIYRMPREESVIHPPSHCPHCNYSIPWFLNIPLITWLWLRGHCANCKAPISVRYFLIELLTGIVFAACWIHYGHISALAAISCCILLAGMIVATFIDVAHLIIPDEITFGGMVVGFLCSLIAPGTHLDVLHRKFMTLPAQAMRDSLLGVAVGAGVIYAIVRGGKLAFGRFKIPVPEGSKVYFGETSVTLPDEELPYEDLFYRRSDKIVFHAQRIELVDRCYWNVKVKLQPHRLQIGGESIEPDKAPLMEVVTGEMTFPREAMGLGDVKFMGAIGAFLGWPATLFSLGVSAIVGTVINVILILGGKRDWSSRLPYGPYIALAAAIWVFGGYKWLKWLF